MYMIIGNADYSNFTTRFLDKKKYSDEENNDNECKKLLPNDSKEFLFCGFVDFKRGINSNRGFNINLKIQQNELRNESHVFQSNGKTKTRI